MSSSFLLDFSELEEQEGMRLELSKSSPSSLIPILNQASYLVAGSWSELLTFTNYLLPIQYSHSLNAQVTSAIS